MEIYLRFNDDFENDYAFQISNEDTINSKIKKIFSTTPNKSGMKNLSDIMVLRPSIFHEWQPYEYYKSCHPGYLTEGGCLLYSYDAAEPQYLEKLDEEKPLFDQLWPGQLIIPKWKYSGKYVKIFAVIMLAWLYTDLPDVISPTPGICLTNNISRLVIPLLDNYLDQPELADKLREEIAPNFSSVLAQWAFFFLHILKITMLTFLFKIGVANPLTFNALKIYKLRNFEISHRNAGIKDVLKSIGWIGSRKASYDQYQASFYNYTIKKHGGIVQAYRAGVIKSAAAPGMPLHAGEGFQTPLNERFTGKTFETIESENPKFILSEEYYVEVENNLKSILEKCNNDIGLMNEEIKRFRRFGIFEPNEKMQHLVKLRKEVYTQEKELEEKEKESKEAKKQK
ncbi:hypothetical protein KAFR_0E00400 [Kazachstania africana CBS 2517]|uniref:Glucose-signaling factor 2 n=1 Tax=Kazachstania africana (strain ATCC 22294 / BCRC 22015 / CBS 2517 / CECT 1963 / NBRC 1671 / NRRL Y-8276) TaxID=1071382 RepID=H2AUZ4_KAZAF|nr:hypothetical protein KAFR_0E00400 [Kazachstania africana CBS 2517]CCF58194.1 hypothetical protein KAFR_0E00400 [Kazachstania africana CBS 2517]